MNVRNRRYPPRSLAPIARRGAPSTRPETENTLRNGSSRLQRAGPPPQQGVGLHVRKGRSEPVGLAAGFRVEPSLERQLRRTGRGPVVAGCRRARSHGGGHADARCQSVAVGRMPDPLPLWLRRPPQLAEIEPGLCILRNWLVRDQERFRSSSNQRRDGLFGRHDVSSNQRRPSLDELPNYRKSGIPTLFCT